jgi:putative addiction module component (TIGR02574 family)
MTLQQLGIDRLTVAERFDLIGQIWDSLVDSEAFEIPVEHREELERRIASADAHPDAAVPWETVKARLLNRP